MRFSLLALVIFAAAGRALAQPAASSSDSPKPGDLVTNPTYALWAGFAVGTSVTQKEAVTLADGSIVESLTTARLVSKHPDRLTVETTVAPLDAAKRAGVIDETKTLVIYHSEAPFEEFQTPESAGYSVTKGKEVLEVRGKAMEAEWIEANTSTSDGSVTEKDWYAVEVPGGLVKQTVTKKKGEQITSQSTLELVDMKIKHEAKKE